MKFAIQVNGSPYGSQSGVTAYEFIKAAIGLGHDIERVFFYRDGVYHAFATMRPPDDERHPSLCWSDLAARFGVDLVVCISAAQRRGLSIDQSAEPSPSPGFRIAGLGLWVDACLKADRFLVF